MIVLKQHDRRPYFRVALLDSSGQPLDLTTALAVRFSMELAKDPLGVTVDRADAVITDPSEGLVEYHWQAGDTDAPGIYNAEFEIEWAPAEYETQPVDTYLKVRIVPDIA